MRADQNRLIALTNGDVYYFNGNPCKYGHICNRYTKTSNCVECFKGYMKSWKEENKDKTAIHNKTFREIHPDEVRAANIAWRKENIDRVREFGRLAMAKERSEFPERSKERLKKWRQNNPGKVKLDAHMQHEGRKQATPPWITREQLIDIFDQCPQDHHVDHIVPFRGITPDGYRVSGLNVPWNLQFLTVFDNMSKHNRMSKRCYEIACSLRKETK